MLTGITLENFKAFKEPQFIPIKPITLVFGPNSAGKSSIIHALAYLRHYMLNLNFSEANVIKLGWSEVTLGGVKKLVHGHSKSEPITISAELDKKSAMRPWKYSLPVFARNLLLAPLFQTFATRMKNSQ